MILISQDLVTEKKKEDASGMKKKKGGKKSKQNGASLAPSCHLPPVHFSAVRYPTDASAEKCIDFNRVLFACSAPYASRLTHLFSHLSLFFFFFFFSVLKRVMLARCFSHYSGSGCRPSMIALHSLSFSPGLTRIVSLHDSHTNTPTRTHRRTRTRASAPST